MGNLSLFDPVVAHWFLQEFGAPTDIQDAAWPVISAGRHALVTAPTGSGKTLTAFLWALDSLFTGRSSAGVLSVLYVSPLKALTRDIRENLLHPLAGIRSAFHKAGRDVPEIHVLTRTGDTSQSERQRMSRRPPEILITTPESLGLLLASPRAREMLRTVGTVILDEIHSVAGSKRGALLAAAVERICVLAGDVQRIALSATVSPLETVALFAGGYTTGEPDNQAARPVEVVRTRREKELTVSITYAGEPPGEPEDEASIWRPYVTRFLEVIHRNRSTLFFATNRRHAEKITLLINQFAGETIAYAHHGSLSRELRHFVETRLKSGDLRAIVATTSLELGIDVGSVDEVVLIKTPFTVSSAIQMIGRSGHRVGETSRGQLFPTFGRDLLHAAVCVDAVLNREIEPLRPVTNPLDVLAQLIVSMVGLEPWPADELFEVIRRSYPFHTLARTEFDAVLHMLAGRYRETRIRELTPRVAIDEVTGSVSGRPGSLRLVYGSGGTIPDRGYYTLRSHQTQTRIGQLDEEFVWERRTGDVFVLGSQVWKIMRITDQDVEVVPMGNPARAVPFWRGEPVSRPFHLSHRILTFLEQVDGMIERTATGSAAALRNHLKRAYTLDEPAIEELLRFLQSQRAATRLPLPHRHHVVLEKCPQEGADLHTAFQWILHTGWGRSVNVPLSLMIEAQSESREGRPTLETFAENDSVLIRHHYGPEDTLHRLPEMIMHLPPERENIMQLLRKRLESTGFFGARFRENAGRALLLPRSDPRRRMPLWLNRRRARTLLATVQSYNDFPILLETWRTCIQDEFDLPALSGLIGELADGEIELSVCETAAPSPFAREVVWQTTNSDMYDSDAPAGTTGSSLSDGLLREAVFGAHLRPPLPQTLVTEVEARLQRTLPGYPPASDSELVEWVKERLFIPEAEWAALLAAREREQIPPPNPRYLHERLVSVPVGNSEKRGIVSRIFLGHMEALLERKKEDILQHALPVPLTGIPRPRVPAASGRAEKATSAPEEISPERALAQWLRFYAPIPPQRITTALGISPERATALLQTLSETGEVVTGIQLEDGSHTVCDAENLEFALRTLRARQRTRLVPRRAIQSGAFLAVWQGITSAQNRDPAGPRRNAEVEATADALEPLLGRPAPAELWESALLPARVPGYRGVMLDSLLSSTELVWTATAERQICFLPESDLDLIRPSNGGNDTIAVDTPLPPGRARHNFWDLAGERGVSSAELANALWEAAWNRRVSTDSFGPVRRGIATRFTPEMPEGGGHNLSMGGPGAARRRPRRGRRFSWRASHPDSGNWFRLPEQEMELDPIGEEELWKDRTRMLLDRFGILYRELLSQEAPVLGWQRVFRTLRIMELAGEVVSGQFFEELSGPQFARPAALRAFHNLDKNVCEAVYWMNAADPASPCGIIPAPLEKGLPARLASNYVVWHGLHPALVILRNGAELQFAISPEEARDTHYYAVFGHLTGRDISPTSRVTVSVINGQAASESVYADCLLSNGFQSDHKRLVLWASYT